MHNEIVHSGFSVFSEGESQKDRAVAKYDHEEQKPEHYQLLPLKKKKVTLK